MIREYQSPVLAWMLHDYMATFLPPYIPSIPFQLSEYFTVFYYPKGNIFITYVLHEHVPDHLLNVTNNSISQPPPENDGLPQEEQTGDREGDGGECSWLDWFLIGFLKIHPTLIPAPVRVGFLSSNCLLINPFLTSEF